MTIVVSGHQVDIAPDMRADFIKEVAAISEKFSAGMTSAHVIFGRGARDLGYTCEITAHLPGNKSLHASGDTRGEAINLAFAGAARKLETQVRRLVRANGSHLRLVAG